MPKPLIRMIFAAVPLLCLVQYDLIGRVGEPYPAIMMPGFSGSGGSTGTTISSTRCMVSFQTTAGNRVTMPSAVLLAGIYTSHRKHACQTFKTLDDPVDRIGLMYSLFPAIRSGIETRDSPAAVKSLRDWLRTRARELVPDQSVSSATVLWYRDTFTPNGKLISTTPIDSSEFDLSP